MKPQSYIFKKLNYLYNVHDTFTAGIMLEGWEVASLKVNGCILDATYCGFLGNDFNIFNSKITPMKNHISQNKNVSDKESRPRKLLLNKSEINKIKDKLNVKGFTCVPAKLYQNNNGLWKLDIAIVTGKKLYDKREALKKKDLERESKRNDI